MYVPHFPFNKMPLLHVANKTSLLKKSSAKLISDRTTLPKAKNTLYPTVLTIIATAAWKPERGGNQ